MEKIEMESVVRVLDRGKKLINQLKVKLHGLIKSEEDDCCILLTEVASSIDHALEKLGCMPLSVSNELGLTNSTTGGDNHKVQRFTDKKRKALPTRSVQVKFSGKETEGLLDDGFQWRKYGQKKILNAKHPRAYYRCKNRFTQQCLAKRYVQKSDDDSRVLDIYHGSHTCEQEKPKKHKKNPILYTKQEDQWQPDPVDELLRNDLRDSEKRSLIPNFPYRVPPASDLVPEAGGSDSRMEIRDLNDGIKNIMLESGELKLESKELLQTGKSDKHEGKVEHHNDYIPRSYSHGPLPRVLDTGRDSSRVEGKLQNDAHEAVGENRDEIKGDDKLKEKDRRRKEVKNWEWGDRDKERSDQRSSLQLPNISGEDKDVLREERKPERGVNDEKEQQKDRDKLTEKEKDLVKKEPWSVPDKEAAISDRRLGEIPKKCVDTENSVPESKKKDSDTFKNLEREPRDKKKERDADGEPERSEKRVRIHEREPDEGGVEGGVERERDVFNSGVAQRKRMLQPRSSPQAEHRDSRFKPAANDTEGPQNKADVSCVYKIGECMQELVKLWKEYELSQSDKTSDDPRNGPTLEIRIPAEHVTATNRQVRGGQLWGTDVYTVDSDLVAVLMHTGFCRPTVSPPPPAIQELRATIRVLPPQECYVSTLRNNVRSRAWGAAIGCSYRVEKCCIVKKGGGVIDLEPSLTHSSTTEPTLAPVAVERTMTTRPAASNALRQQRFVREVTIQFNLCMEPWLKYSISAVADKGLKRSFFTSARLKKGEVLYVETHTRRYELCFNGEKVTKTSAAETGRTQTHSSHHSNGERSAADGDTIDLFRWSRCKRPLPQKFMQSIGIPLPPEHVEILEENLEWEDVSWSQTGVWIAGKEYQLARAHFLAPN